MGVGLRAWHAAASSQQVAWPAAGAAVQQGPPPEAPRMQRQLPPASADVPSPPLLLLQLMEDTLTQARTGAVYAFLDKMSWALILCTPEAWLRRQGEVATGACLPGRVELGQPGCGVLAGACLPGGR